MRTFYYLLAAMLLWAQSANAQTIPLDSREHFIITTPDGWYLAYQKGNLEYGLSEYVPVGQKVDAWKDMLAYNVMPLPSSVDLRTYISAESSVFDICQSVEKSEPEITTDSNRSIAYVTVTCKQPAPLPNEAAVVLAPVEIYFSKYISSNQKIYKIWRAWHGTEEEAKALPADFTHSWRSMLDRIELCDLDDPDMICHGLGVPSAKTGNKDILDRIAIAEATENAGKKAAVTTTGMAIKDRAVGIFIAQPLIQKDKTSLEGASEVISLSLAEHQWQSQEKFLALLKSAYSSLARGHEVTLVATNQGDASRSRLADRKLVANYFLLIQRLLFQAKIPHENMEILLPTPTQGLTGSKEG